MSDDRFSEVASNLFDVLSSQGYFDFEANYTPNQQSVNLSMHRKCYRYDILLRTDTSTIWDDSIQLAFLVALENLSEIDIASGKYSIDSTLHRFHLSGFTNIKTLNPIGGFSIYGIFEGHRISCKIAFKDISDQIIFLRKHALSEAKRTGIYRGIDPRYTVAMSSFDSDDFQVEKNFDSMDGHEFEFFCSELLAHNGYEDVSVTKGSGDQGVDIIAYKSGKKYGIQCKCYSSNVGNKAVMETYAGISFYGCDVGAVLTNRYYTPAAKDMAARTKIILWDREDLFRLNCHKKQ